MNTGGAFDYLGRSRYIQGFFFGLSSSVIRYLSHILFWQHPSPHKKNASDVVKNLMLRTVIAFGIGYGSFYGLAAWGAIKKHEPLPSPTIKGISGSFSGALLAESIFAVIDYFVDKEKLGTISPLIYTLDP